MSTPLIDWLYNDDSTKQGALIMFSRMINRWNIASLIVTNWEDYKVAIITDFPNEFMNVINDHSHWTDLELVPFSLISYSDLDEINRYLHNTEIDIVLFDDARMLATIASAINFSAIPSKIIVLTTWGDTMKQLDIVTTKLPDLKLLTLDLINDTIGIDWKVIYTPMSSRQMKYYDMARAQEIKIESIIPYSLTRMLTLYAYPDSMVTDTIRHLSVCENNTKGALVIPDNLNSPGSWLNSSYLDKLDDDGPKLASILDSVIANWPSKQIVVTRFNHRYGVDLIVSFLELLVQGKSNPYEMTEIFSISCTDEYEKIISTLHRFNDSPSGVLVTNIIPLIPLKGISVIHIADSYSFLTIKAILDRCYKRSLIKSESQPQDLIIYSHVATLGRESKILPRSLTESRSPSGAILTEQPLTSKSSDESLYEGFISDIETANKMYSGLIAMGGHIIFNPKMGLMVK